jgi:hypothetical protein
VPCQLLYPQIANRPLPPLGFGGGTRYLLLPSWPWEATMLTVANCYLLWGFTWLQFVITLSCFSYKGKNLWFYTEVGEPLGLTIPESFLVFSIALSVFALCAVVGATWRTPRLWKRIFTVCIFAGIAVGLSCLNRHLRHYSYARAVESRAVSFKDYHRSLTVNNNSTDEWAIQSLEWQRQELQEYDLHLSKYRSRFPQRKEEAQPQR